MATAQELKKMLDEIFKSCAKEDESDKYLHFSPKYRHPTKVANWFITQEALPKDNDPYHPPGGNYFLSTYRRLGTQDSAPWETTAQAMLRQVCDVERDASPYKPMVDFTTKRLLEEDPEDYKGLDNEDLDYVTTYSYDYRYPFPHAVRYSMKTEEKTPHFGIQRTPINFHPDQCETKYLDDDLYVTKSVPATKQKQQR